MLATPGSDPTIPSQARSYDYLLGGTANLPVDRQAMDDALTIAPGIKQLALDNRSFLVEAVSQAASAGITQFLDIGSGLPTMVNVHEAAQRITPEARTIYVDNDVSVLPYAAATIQGDPNTVYIEADMRDPRQILTHPKTVGMLDFTQPIALVLVAVLHFIKDSDDPYGLVRRLLGDLPPGSWLIMSHASMDNMDPMLRQLIELHEEEPGRDYMAYRSRNDFARFFEGLELLSPGIAEIDEWLAHTGAGQVRRDKQVIAYCAVACKR